uniref:Uncharacterized protein n=1 Tax=Nelumbo nucifera TaxID=4432 RepID=A0A822Y9N2_NELNU|nr:TPA_asm: hypothetical protein HUJ06_029324 [Nelumbo nucifera]
MLVEDDKCFSYENFGRCYYDDDMLPKIDVRVSNNNMIIRNHCEKHKGVVVRALGEMEYLHLNVLNISVIPFRNLALDITIVALGDLLSSYLFVFLFFFNMKC